MDGLSDSLQHSTRLIDTHCHLYLSEFDHDIDKVIKTAVEAGVQQLYFPAIDSSHHEKMLDLANKYPAYINCMMGLHPCSVNKSFREELETVRKYLEQGVYSAIGEVGLDYYWDTSFKNEQMIAFEQQMEWALAFSRPLVIHTRQAMNDTLAAVAPFAARGLTGIFHCFGDSYDSACQILDMGFLLGIGGIVTYKKSGLQDVLKKISLNHIVLETDAPYLSPVPFRGKRNQSSYLTYIAAVIASIKECNPQEVAHATTTNAQKIFARTL